MKPTKKNPYVRAITTLGSAAAAVAVMSSTSQATILAYDGFGDALNNTTLNGYDGTTAESGFAGAWIAAGGTNNTFTPPLFGNQVGIVGGVAPENTGGAQHVVRKAQFNTGSLTRALSSTIDLTVDGSHFMSFFGAASGFDFVCQVGLSNATHELMAGQAYNGNRGLTAYYGTNGTSVTSNVAAGNNLNAFNWADRNAFFTVQFTKTNSGTTNDVAVTITAYDLGNTVNVDINTLVEGTTKKTRTVNLTGVSAVFDKLKVKLDGTVEFDEIRLGQSLSEVITGGDSDLDGLADFWENLYFGNLSRDGTLDFDSDGLTDLQDFTAGTNPTLADTDGDSLSDGGEISGTANLFAPGTPTSAVLADSDGDGATDSEEVNGTLNIAFSNAPTNPNVADTDADGVRDYKEFAYGSNPNNNASVPNPSLFYIINNTKRNGSFESLGAPANLANAANNWDTDPDGDVLNWTNWSIGTASNDSGTEAGGATQGTRRGFLQNGNAVYNLADIVAAEGDVFAATWKMIDAGPLSGYLVYNSGTEAVPVITKIDASVSTTTNAGNTGDVVYRIPAGSPAIGKKIGLGFTGGRNWIHLDEAALNIADKDSDADGLGDYYEDQVFGNNDGIPMPAELTVASGSSDNDSDGLTTTQEIASGTNPLLADTDGDTLNDGAEVSGSGNLFDPGYPTNPLLADTDGDKVADNEEVNGTLNTAFSLEPTDPNGADTDGDGAKDYKELVFRSNPNDSGNLPTPAQFALISNTLLNGSFETRNGGTQITTKIPQWDQAAPNDIDNWTEWSVAVGGISTAPNDSGADGGGSNGTRVGYFQSGNAAYNMTTSVAAAGSVYSGSWKQLNNAGSTISVRLVYKNASNQILAIPGSLATTNTITTGELLHQIPAGSPAIGFPIGIAVSSQGAWINTDEFALNIAATDDDDGDGLLNLWEVANGLNPNNAVGVNGASGDPDGDGYSNLAEQAAGSNPQLIASIPGDIDGDALGDAWETTNFGGLSNPAGAPGLDPDGDKDTNLVEFTNSTNPNDKLSFYSDPADSVPNSWETFYGIPTATTGATDSDSDGLTNLQEFNLNTNPTLTDTDIDGLSDGYEVNTSLTNPLGSDSDNDGLLDGAEVNTHLTGPNDADSDDDGYSDGAEITAGSNPLSSSSTPFNVGGAVILIDPTHNNGSFETGTGKIANWGSVDFWDEWTGVSGANGDSGTDDSAAATQGTRVAFLQGNNATYNMTTHVVAVGDVYTFQWDHVLRNSSHSVSLVWNNGGTITSIVASEVTSTTIGNGNGTSYEVLPGNPAIGSTIGLGLRNNNSNYPEVDNFILIVTPASGAGDSDSDGMTDTWETTYFGNLAQTATGDFDSDGTDNLAEFRLGLIPNSGSSSFAATAGPAIGQLTWPSVTGVTFTIERSTTLSGWTVLEAAFAGTAGTASYTDPAPPVGKAFYKVTLNP